MSIDFLCVGFPKGGTTTLDDIMRRNDNIELPIIKETYGFRTGAIQNNIKEWEKTYFGSKNILKNKMRKQRGAIDPSFAQTTCAKEIKKYFGKEIKIIFMIRDVSKMQYSSAKMSNKYIYNKKNDYYRTRNIKFNEQFSDYLKREYKPTFRTKYWSKSKILKSYIKEFGQENIKIIVFEEFIKNPKQHMIQIYNFLNVEYDEHQEWNSWKNQGNRISKNSFCSRINEIMYKIFICNHIMLAKLKLIHIYYKIFMFILKYTTIEDDSEIFKEDLNYLRKVALDDVIELEKITNKNLREIWGW